MRFSRYDNRLRKYHGFTVYMVLNNRYVSLFIIIIIISYNDPSINKNITYITLHSIS